jgi:glyoxylase-like metal-dependent hydrolase (beta-lactamase superfamily II)
VEYLGSKSSDKLKVLNGTEISTKIFLFKPMSSNLLTSNTLLFDDESKLIVDAGFQHGTHQLQDIKEFFDIGTDDILFLSHYHLDHIIGSHLFPESQKLIHQSEKNALLTKETFLKFCFQFNVDQQELNDWKTRFKAFLNYEGLSEWDDLALTNVQSYTVKNTLDLGEIDLKIIHLPGHSPGHCGLYELSSKILFITDVDLSKFGPWYGWRSSNLEDFRLSIRFLQDFIQENDISMIIPSHTSPINDKDEAIARLSRYYHVIDKRKEKILEFISKNPGTTIHDITNQSFIYQGKESKPSFVFKTFEYFHIEHHLNELKKEDSIYFKNNRSYPS